MNEPQTITLPRQEWFDSHYHWAADIVGSWIGEEIDIRSATIVDFGCGDGTTGLGVADNFSPRMVIGVDVRDSFRNIAVVARNMAPTKRLPTNIRFLQTDPAEPLRNRLSANAVFSWSCFEHIDRSHLAAIFADIHDLLPYGGVFFLQIEPLYFSPFGSHLSTYIEEPWGHLLMSEEEIQRRIKEAEPSEKARQRMRNPAQLEQQKSYHLKQYLTLNKVTADEIANIGRDAGFTVKKEIRSQVDIEPPAALVAQYGRDALLTNETRILFKKIKPLSAENFVLKAKRFVRHGRNFVRAG